MPSKKTKENQAVSFFKIFLEPDLIINFLICFATFHMVSFQSDLLRQDTCSQLALCSLRVCSVTSVMSDSLPPYGLQPTRLLWSMGFSRQGYWNRLPCPPPRDLPDPRTEPLSQASPVLAGGFFITSTMFFAMPEYWSGLPFPSPRYLPKPGIEPYVSYVACIAGRFFTR